MLTQNEILRFLHQAKEEGYYELFLLELGTGMRRGEILAPNGATSTSQQESFALNGRYISSRQR